ncbi:putative NADH:ubiquinone oxidoreductase, chain C [Candidatus Zinderia insecticola CARI]|uniref:NADH-quinone oxidoreductase subunit C n=1 Tax=Zinderia insecticola (strain CARI) TaxID=871271 RepID=E0TIU7_ZINIC|nr:putative NADH:ubiquinone oxidoreductase, chain C [Candidatus Zinderia insecticola CARI]
MKIYKKIIFYIKKKIFKYIIKINFKFKQINILVNYINYLYILSILKNNKKFKFKTLIDFFCIDYLNYKSKKKFRFQIILNLLSIKYNMRIRIKIFLLNKKNPYLFTINNLWKSSNWYEREAYDMYGINFKGHYNLKRILTDYNFIGFPMRKDFPLSGFYELKYNNKKKNVFYKKINLKKKEIIPKIFDY